MPNLKPELSYRNRYKIDKHRYYELKHFCLQYPQWTRDYVHSEIMSSSSVIVRTSNNNTYSDPTAERAILRAKYSSKIQMVNKAAKECDEDLGRYILKAVTEGLSYIQMAARFNVPCSRDTYYDRYRKFFWLLDQARD